MSAGYHYRVTYRGLLQRVVREFDTHRQAEQWLMQVGLSKLVASIERIQEGDE